MRQGTIANLVLGIALIVAVAFLIRRTTEPAQAQLQSSPNAFAERNDQPQEDPSQQVDPIVESRPYADEPELLSSVDDESWIVDDKPTPFDNQTGLFAGSPFQPELPAENASGSRGDVPCVASGNQAPTYGQSGTSVAQYHAAEPEPINEKARLQSQYVELATRRAQLMTFEELNTAITAAEAETNEVAARRQLEEARDILSRLLEKHPDSKAARKAREMLEFEQKKSADADEGSGDSESSFDYATDGDDPALESEKLSIPDAIDTPDETPIR